MSDKPEAWMEDFCKSWCEGHDVEWQDIMVEDLQKYYAARELPSLELEDSPEKMAVMGEKLRGLGLKIVQIEELPRDAEAFAERCDPVNANVITTGDHEKLRKTIAREAAPLLERCEGYKLELREARRGWQAMAWPTRSSRS